MFKIGEFARICGLSPKMLRHYEQLSLLQPAHTDRFTSYRYYTLDQLETLERIQTLREVGFTLREIRDVLASDLTAAQFHALLVTKQQTLRERFEQIRQQLEQVGLRLAELERGDTMPSYEIILKPVAPEAPDEPGEHLPLFAPPDGVPMQIVVDADEPVADLLLRIDQPHEPELLVCTIHRGEPAGMLQAFRALQRWIKANGWQVVAPPRLLDLPPDRANLTEHAVEIQMPVRRL